MLSKEEVIGYLKYAIYQVSEGMEEGSIAALHSTDKTVHQDIWDLILDAGDKGVKFRQVTHKKTCSCGYVHFFILFIEDEVGEIMEKKTLDALKKA